MNAVERVKEVRRSKAAKSPLMMMITHEGDCMAPTIKEGDALVIDLNDLEISPADRAVYLFLHRGESLVRRLYHAEGGQLMAEPFNQKHSSTLFGPAGDFEILGKVVSIGRPVAGVEL